MIFFNIFNLNPRSVIMKAAMHLLNATEVTTCRDGVETYHVKMLNDLLSHSGLIFKQNPLFFHNPRLC